MFWLGVQPFEERTFTNYKNRDSSKPLKNVCVEAQVTKVKLVKDNQISWNLVKICDHEANFDRCVAIVS